MSEDKKEYVAPEIEKREKLDKVAGTPAVTTISGVEMIG